MTTDFIQPDHWAPAKGYSNGVVIDGTRTLFVAGQIAWNADQELVAKDDFAGQFKQAISNVAEVVSAAGAKIEQVGRLTIYVTSKARYMAEIKEVGAAYREVFGKHFPAMALLEVKDLLEEGAMVEIEATAILP